MIIEPNTTLYILKDIPLDTSYDHTIYFGSKEAQATYFMSKQKYPLTQYTYQRVNRGKVRVGIQADNLYDCNYIMFQNTAFGNKWFYAYITAVEYINNTASDITYEIDTMQTWHFDYSVDYCFVEREHSTSDVIGDNIQPEPVDVGEYLFNSYYAIADGMGDLGVIIGIVDTDEETHGNRYDGVFGGATLYYYLDTSIDSINALLNNYLQKPDAVVCMYMVPRYLMQGISEGQIPGNTGASSHILTLGSIDGTETLDGYTPRNKKLYTYPYNFMHVDNASGQGLTLRYEFYQGLSAKAEIVGCFNQPVQMALRPYNYKNVFNKKINTEQLVISEYPTCSWAADYYAAWMAQNSIPMFAQSIPAIAGAMTGIATGDSTMITPAITQIANVISRRYQASIHADIMGGTATSGNVNAANHILQYYAGRMSISSGFAKVIDDFFDRFGYATNRLKIPNRNSRPVWNYVKTVGCTLTGSIPADDMKKLCSIYDAGVTFWKSGASVGNYGLNNQV